jgi:hypothetical protein
VWGFMDPRGLTVGSHSRAFDANCVSAIVYLYLDRMGLRLRSLWSAVGLGPLSWNTAFRLSAEWLLFAE